MTTLKVPTGNSYQNLNNLLIECPICLENKNNFDCIMAECKHSWCKDCNTNLNRYNLNKCPICKKEFINIPLKNGEWKYNLEGEISWRKGTNDSKNLLIKKKLWQIYYNTFIKLKLHEHQNVSFGVNI